MICQPLEIRYQYPPPPSSSINHPSSSPRMKKNRPGTHPNYNMGMNRDAIRSLSVPPTRCILTFNLLPFWHEKRLFRKWADWEYEKMPTDSPLLSSRRFRPFAILLLARLFRSSALTESLLALARTKYHQGIFGYVFPELRNPSLLFTAPEE